MFTMHEEILFKELKADKTAAREKAMSALEALEPIYLTWAEFAAEEDYKNPEAVCWEVMRQTGEYETVKKALAYYLVHPFCSNMGTIAFILSNDAALEVNDLYLRCYEMVLNRLVRVYRNVNASFNSKKGVVSRSEGWTLYMDRMLASFLIDEARKYDPEFGRTSAKKNVVNHFEVSGQELRCAEELQPGMVVIRKGNRIGTCMGSLTRNGAKYCHVECMDGCSDFIPWEQVTMTVRRFTGNIHEVLPVKNEEEEKTSRSRIISLDALLNDEDDGVSLMKLVPGSESCEDVVLRKEMNEVLRRCYLSTVASLKDDFSEAMMFFYLVHDYLSLEFTHYPSIVQRLSEVDPMTLAADIHQQNCRMLDISPDEQVLKLDCDCKEGGYSVRQLTVAKNHAKSQFRKNLTQAMAA